MSDGGVVTVSADKLLALADKIRILEDELRQIGLAGYGMQTAPRAPQRKKSESEAMPIEFDVLSLGWTKSKKSGGGDADPETPWAWTFAYPDADSPDPRSDCHELVMSLHRYGEVRCGRYIIKLGGRDSRLLNRSIAK